MTNRDCIKWLWDISRGNRRRILLSAAVGIMYVAASMTFVILSKLLVDAATSSETSNITLLICSLIICILLQIILSAINVKFTNISDLLLKNRLRSITFNSLMLSRWEGKESLHTGDTLNRLTEDLRIAAESLSKSVPTFIVAAVQFLAALCFLMILEPLLALVIPAILLIFMLLSRRYLIRMRKLNGRIRSDEGRLHALMQESLQNRLVIHSLERTPYVSQSLEIYQNDLLEHVIDKTDFSIFTRSLLRAGFSLGYASAFICCVLGLRDGSITFGMMTALLQLVAQIQRPVMNMARQISPFLNSLTSAERLSELNLSFEEKEVNSVNLGDDVGVRFSNVCFAYKDAGKTVIKDLKHDFKPGSSTALIGETGIGKSTVMRLVLGLLTPDKGHVHLYNQEQEVSASEATRCNIVYVPQGNSLLSGTIRENLLLGNPEADESDMKKALHTAAADFVFDFQDKLDTLCGENGAGLSEGQAQRICIARALLHKGGLLLLDEPTAALDPETEEILLYRLSKEVKGKTMLIVTHREAVVNLCDEVLRIG